MVRCQRYPNHIIYIYIYIYIMPWNIRTEEATLIGFTLQTAKSQPNQASPHTSQACVQGCVGSCVLPGLFCRDKACQQSLIMMHQGHAS